MLASISKMKFAYFMSEIIGISQKAGSPPKQALSARRSAWPDLCI
ncbi:hypothetical protein [Paraburkholderia strydomiana]